MYLCVLPMCELDADESISIFRLGTAVAFRWCAAERLSERQPTLRAMRI